MKKFVFRFTILLCGLLGISIANNAVLLNIHPMGFYYTPKGLMFAGLISAVEVLILVPTVQWYVNRFLVKALEELEEKESN